MNQPLILTLYVAALLCIVIAVFRYEGKKIASLPPSEKKIPAKENESGWVGGVLILGGIAWAAVSFLSPDDWTIKYSARYLVPYDHVHVDGRPTSCDWMHAPLGDKACHYEKTVFKMLTIKAPDGDPIYSNDEGKTWSDGAYHQSTKDTIEDVFVSWQKKEDP